MEQVRTLGQFGIDLDQNSSILLGEKQYGKQHANSNFVFRPDFRISNYHFVGSTLDHSQFL